MNITAIKSVVIISLIIGLFFWHKYEVNTAVNDYAVAKKLEYATELNRLTEANIKTKIEMAEKVKALQENKYAEIKSNNARYDSIIASLQQRPSRQDSQSNSTSNSNSTESSTGTTGAGLYKEDANFLAGYARDTERLKVELLACYKQYNEVQNIVNTFIEKHK